MNNGRKDTPRMALGRAGEDAVCEFLSRRGHSIIERNCRVGHLEIDIISLDKVGVHFVEVKTRMAPFTARPEENVDRTKQRRIVKAAMRYLATSRDGRLGKDLEILFDVAAVVFDGGEVRIDWFPQAYCPMYF
ncbi:MAG: YraN family protein [Bacteroidales bacterium]|nr:YraN family protein [Bacteroidales bacterium]